jgi:hypothetical protein
LAEANPPSTARRLFGREAARVGDLQVMTLRGSWALAQMASCGQLAAPAVLGC